MLTRSRAGHTGSEAAPAQVLCFTGNQIKEIPDFIFKMVSLTKLILVENQVCP